jgi:hypothetical protein
MEDSRLHQLWRLTTMFLTIKRPPGEGEVDESGIQNDYVHENKAS